MWRHVRAVGSLFELEAPMIEGSLREAERDADLPYAVRAYRKFVASYY